ncbi:hypothetical protein IWX84_003130 [Flavobacterium sp. CG_9.10]|uniref:hypothetical protein n=1 Tax=Flavobacterium sp. CG_9.10 TaxID=2787729 RepID=UPI0018CBA69D|nr:hypothetical protein [Flavobacterium sp. CG_9.10]MBG6112227.1 hypothetical protein [Flavobacterium sp. CG_9.10]
MSLIINFEEEKYDYYPIVIIPNDILDLFDKKISNKQIWDHSGISFYDLRSTVFCDTKNYFNLSNERTEITLNDFLNLEKDVIFSLPFRDFYLSSTYKEKYKLPKRPQKWKSINVERNSSFLIIFSLGMTFLIFFIINSNSSLEFALISLVSILLFLIIGFASGIFKRSYTEIKELEPEEFKILTNRFYEDVETIKTIVEQDFKNYEKEKIKLADVHRLKVENDFFLKSLEPQYLSRKKTKAFTKGKSENFFLSILYKNFGNQVTVDVVPDIGKNPFQPDFLIICSQTNFHLIIEIDEPYSVENGLPIHHERSTDSSRNDFFKEINWGIIRFSEKQIIQNTNECCDLIINVLEALRTKQKKVINNVQLDKKWTYEEAIIMCNDNYRNDYLPCDMKIKVKYKTIENNFEQDDLPF